MEETGNLNSGLFFYIFKSVTRCKYLDMLIEGRIGTRAGSEHYGQGRSDWQNGSIAEEGKRYLKEHFLLDISEYDVIIGYRADDSYFSFAQDFVAGVISLQKLSEAMRLGKLGEQIVLKSPQAFEKIQYVKSEPVDMQAYYIKKIERERAARKEYRMSKRQKADLNELFILDIMREEMENDDPRLF